jgi:hypothetical protein
MVPVSVPAAGRSKAGASRTASADPLADPTPLDAWLGVAGH